MSIDFKYLVNFNNNLFLIKSIRARGVAPEVGVARENFLASLAIKLIDICFRHHCISQSSLELLLENRFTVPQIARMFEVSVSTIRRRMSELGLFVRAYYSTISDRDLDELVSSIQQQYPMCGNRQMQGHLLYHGHRVQQISLRDSQRRIDPNGTALRRLHVLNRRTYSVPAPLSLYHIDGHHKLIR